MRSPGDDSNAPAGGLDEFADENRANAAVKIEQVGGNLFVFECEAEPPAPMAPPSDALFDVAPAAVPRNKPPAALSRTDAKTIRRREKAGLLQRLAARAATWRERLSRGGDTVRAGAIAGANVVSRATAATTASRHALRRTVARLREHMRPAPPAPTPISALEYQESNGFVVAVLLGMAVVGYGSFLVGSWRQPGRPTRPAATVASAAVLPAASPGPVATGVMAEPRVVIETRSPLSGTPRAVSTRPASVSPSARTLNAMWQRRDTRSLNQAFDSLRHQTLAFHRCGMRIVDADRAVARCEGVASAGAQASRAAMWTIDFQRAAGRWTIARVTTR
jgi:hypothetical protein